MSLSTAFAGDFAYHASTPGATFPASPTPPQMDLPIAANHLKVVAETAPVDFSFDGVNVHGTVKPADGPVDFVGISQVKIWFKSAGGSVRAWAWHNG